MKLLHIDSSIQGDASASRALSAAVVERLLADGAGAEVIYRDFAASPIDHLTLAALGDDDTGATVDEFLDADTVVIGAPLYNFTVSTQLKAWIDRILIRGKTFSYGENGAPEGLAGGKRVIIALARGGLYGEGSPFASFEHAETLLQSVFSFIGIPDAQFIVAEGLALGDERRRAAIEAALVQIAQIAPERLAA